MNDPLSLVRQAIISNTPVNYSDNYYSFGAYKFHESTKTCFKRSLKTSTGDIYYTLRDVIFFLENSDASIADYRRRAFEAKATAIIEQDRVSLKDYLAGTIDICPQLDLAAAAAFVNVPTDRGKRDHAASSSTNESGQRPSSSHGAAVKDSGSKSEDHKHAKKSHKKRESLEKHKTGSSDSASIQEDRKVLAGLRANEHPALTRGSVLCKTGLDFSFALKLFNDRILRAMAAAKVGGDSTGDNQAVKSQNQSQIAGKLLPTASMGANPKPVITGTPIIIVPSALTSCITTINAPDLLEKGAYFTVEEKMQKGGKREQEKYITRTVPGGSRKMAFKIIDNPKFLRDEDWDRVVAVFASGQAWQFKEFKWSNPADLFQHVLGFHLTMDDRAVDANIMSWNCKVLKVYQFKRHLDAEASNEFWATLDDFMKLHKPSMLLAP